MRKDCGEVEIIYMSDNSQNNKRIAKNTLMLYVRMILIMLVSLYTSRVILKTLGVENFGIYNIVGGIVVLFSFINNAMVSSTQRYLNYELGRQSLDEAKKIFSASLTIHFIIAGIIIFLSETIGLWFLNKYINIPEGRIVAANWVYQFSILTFAVNIIRTPYNASIIAYERMSFYAYISIIEVVLKLIIVYAIVIFADRLIAYSVLVFIVAILILICYIIFCLSKFPICKYKYEYNKLRYASLLNFSGWSMFGALANTGAQQGINILLNMFFGVTVNAAMGIAHQVNSALYSFVSNFQTAFNPQIIKSYAANDRSYFFSLILHTSRYSFYLLLILAFPVILCCQEILQIWLVDIPEHAVAFCQLVILFSLIDAWQGPLWVSAQATGKIKNYQLLMSCLILLNLPLTYILFKLIHIPELALIVRVFINIITSIARVLYLKHLYNFPVIEYIKSVILRSLLVVVIAAPIPAILYCMIEKSLLGTTFIIIVCIIITIMAIYYVGITSKEKLYIKSLVRKFWTKRQIV